MAQTNTNKTDTNMVVSFEIFQKLIAHLQTCIAELRGREDLQDWIAESDELVHEVLTKAKKVEE